VPFPADHAPLAGLLATTKLKLPNCILLRTALDQRAALATYDDRLRPVAIDHGVPVLPAP